MSNLQDEGPMITVIMEKLPIGSYLPAGETEPFTVQKDYDGENCRVLHIRTSKHGEEQ